MTFHPFMDKDVRNCTQDQPYAFVQWKGTDVCFDFYCPCGVYSHFDGDFAYSVRCGACGRVFETASYIQFREISKDAPNDLYARAQLLDMS